MGSRHAGLPLQTSNVMTGEPRETGHKADIQMPEVLSPFVVWSGSSQHARAFLGRTSSPARFSATATGVARCRRFIPARRGADSVQSRALVPPEFALSA